MGFGGTVVMCLAAWQIACWFAWFICEIIIHSLNSDYTQGGYLQLQIVQSMQIYQYEGVILAGTLAALFLAEAVKTKAARVASCTIQIFALLAWLWELYYIIPTFTGKGDASNLFCGTFLLRANPTIGFTGENSICNLARAIAALSVCMEFGQLLITIYSMINVVTPPMLEDGTRKEIIEEDDAEVATVVQSNPAGYEVVSRGIQTMAYLTLSMVWLSMIGYALFMFAMIEVVRNTQFPNNGYYGANQEYINYTPSNSIAQLGDPVLSIAYRPLAIVLVFALATSAYACYRHNRGIQCGALMLTGATMLQWWSWIIEGGRYLHQYNAGQNQVTGFPGNAYPNLDANKAMFAGACCIVAGETLRFFFLIGRFFAYIPVTRNNVIPTYIRGPMATANPIPTTLFWLEVIVTFAWFVLQFVTEAETGIFNDDQAPFNLPTAVAVTDTLFILQCLFLVAVFIPELFSERTQTLASKQAALAVNVTVMSAWFLLMWPWVYATVHRTGFFMSATAATGPGFCDAYGNDSCKLAQGAAILAVISGCGYVILAIWQLCKILVILPTASQVATIDGTIVAALPPTVPMQKALGWNCALMLIGLLIWALASIDAGSGYNGFASFTNGQLITTPNFATLSGYVPDQFLGYTYSTVFGSLVILGFTVWSASELASNAVVANWTMWRFLVVGLSGLLFTFFIPFFIMTCRFINWPATNWGTSGATESAMAAGILIMCIGDFTLYFSSLGVLRSPLIALPAAINNTTQPAVKQAGGVPLQNVVVTQPGVQTNVGGYAPSEPTVVTTALPDQYTGDQHPVQ